ncbi:MAG TPA: alpha-L-rhamnosidase C-terminal domain-containing protein [Candidatus Acidoferrum sp.]|nr:alpha-L-rhamnosidase C-terminal domain-containing protein [Candidatus Acidoferrum sp.]
MFPKRIFLILVLAAMAPSAFSQTPSARDKLDLTADIEHPVLESHVHRALPEQFIWLAMPSGTPAKTDQVTPRFFRFSFRLQKPPADATLYIAGPDHVHAYVNGKSVAAADRDPKSKTYPLVLAVPVAKELQFGQNVVAIEGSDGSPLAVKIVPAAEGVLAQALVTSGPFWRASVREESGWQEPTFRDAAWPHAKALGSIDTRVDGYRPWIMTTSNLEWNSDSEMYRWPGYDGISSYLAHLPVLAEAVTNVSEGAGHFENVASLTAANPAAGFVVHVPATSSAGAAPSLVLDFGRESDGRLEITSDSPEPIRLTSQYGESLQEARNEPYLGVNEILVPPYATVHGPKSAFRYAILKFPAAAAPLRFKSIRLDSIYYPVRYSGSFESSDAVLNRIWAVGAYTAHLCMQDAIWDAPKRDRMPWMGDLDVSGHVIDAVFADRFLMRDSMSRLIDEAGVPLNRDVNTIPGYSAFWVMGEADYYRHIGDKTYLMSLHGSLVRLLTYMEGELDDRGLFANTRKAWPFVDWSPDFQKDTPEARAATAFEFYRAFTDGAWLLAEMGDAAGASKYGARAQSMREAAQKFLLDPKTGTFGSRWQENAMAVYSGVADEKQTAAIWAQVLSHPPQFMISPYYNFYAISAMAHAGHRRKTLDWIRKYWGGMIDEGATSFWEGYDPSWPKDDFHANLQADDGKGYYTSLAHGWSSGPTVWLSEEILGVRPTAGGFLEATIRPDLAGLEWARGAVPTPAGLIRLDYKSAKGLDARIEIPPGVHALISMPVCPNQNWTFVDKGRVTGRPAENGSRVLVGINRAGSYDLHSDCLP